MLSGHLVLWTVPCLATSPPSWRGRQRGAARFVLTSPQVCCRGRLTGGRAGGPGSRGTRWEAPKTRKIRCQGFLFILILKTFPPELTLILGNSSTEILTSVHPWDSPQRQDVSGPLPAWPQHCVNTCHASISLLTPRLGLSRQVLLCGHALSAGTKVGLAGSRSRVGWAGNGWAVSRVAARVRSHARRGCRQTSAGSRGAHMACVCTQMLGTFVCPYLHICYEFLSI